MSRPVTRSIQMSAIAAGLAAVAVCTSVTSGDSPAAPQSLASALVFHAPFDGSVDARVAAGDPGLNWAPTWARRQEAQRGLPPAGDTLHARGEGRFGDALRFTRRGAPLVFFNGGPNAPYVARNWQGAASFWLSTDPHGDLGPGFCDPIRRRSRGIPTSRRLRSA